MIITNLTDVDYWFGPMHLAPSGTLNLDDTSDTSLYLLNDEVADAVNTLHLSSNIAVTSYATPFPRAVAAARRWLPRGIGVCPAGVTLYA
jgi:hypothetical protein